MMVKHTHNTRLAYTTNTQAEFDKTFIVSVIRAMSSLALSKAKDKDMVECFYQALKFNLERFDTKGKAYAQIALTYEYQTVSKLVKTVCKELNLQFTDMSNRDKAVEVTRREALKALSSKPKPKPKQAVYVKELNIKKVAVMPIRTIPNIYFGFYNSGDRFEYKRDKEYLETLTITTPHKVKVERVPIVRAVPTAKAPKTDKWKKAQIALNTEYNQKVKELFCA